MSLVHHTTHTVVRIVLPLQRRSTGRRCATGAPACAATVPLQQRWPVRDNGSSGAVCYCWSALWHRQAVSAAALVSLRYTAFGTSSGSLPDTR
jgi:hypothetical protein